MYCSKLNQIVGVGRHSPVVQTTQGKILGIQKEDAYIFRGIKYAFARRFHEPVNPEAWDGIQKALTYGYAAPEILTPIPLDGLVNPHYYLPQNEHCQYLNIWTPTLDQGAKLPIIIWLHGGAWTSGSGVEQFSYDGEELSKFGQVVIVSINHRLNCLSGLDLSSFGSEYEDSSLCGLKDMIQALRWLKENIRAFGGNEDNVTLFGQSGGVAKILFLMQCPEADGLFHKVALDSGGRKEQIIPEGWTRKRLAQRLGELTVNHLGLNEKTIASIEDVPYWYLADAVQHAEQKLIEESGLCGSYRWEPVPDGKRLLGTPLNSGLRKASVDIPMMFGCTFGEGHTNLLRQNQLGAGSKNDWDQETVCHYMQSLFAEKSECMAIEYRRAYPERKLVDVLFMDHEERTSVLNFCRKWASIGGKVWNWLFMLESPLMGGLVAWHCSELPFVFHNAEYIESAFIPGVSQQLQDQMANAWVAFARTGNPNHAGLPNWPAVRVDYTTTMLFDTQCSLVTNHDAKLLDLLRQCNQP